MQRSIKFRGKRLNNGEWVYGYYFVDDSGHSVCHYIMDNNMDNHEVDPATVGQFTGLLDKNGKEIYEGDCFKIELCWPVYIVVWDEKLAQFRLRGEYESTNGKPLAEWIDRAELIGNIYSNPDLLGGDK